MSVPMRKDQPELEENLTTADLAQGKRPASEDRPKEDRPRPVLAERPGENARNIPSGTRTNSSDAAPLFPNTNWKICVIVGAPFRPPSSTSPAAPSSRPTAWSLRL